MADQQANDDAARAAHRILLAMDPTERTTSLLAAIIDAERDTFSAAASMLDVLALSAKYLNQDEREFIASRMVDLAIRLVLRWH
jgi:hypothetical protein